MLYSIKFYFSCIDCKVFSVNIFVKIADRTFLCWVFVLIIGKYFCFTVPFPRVHLNESE